MGSLLFYVSVNIFLFVCLLADACPPNEEYSNCKQAICRPQNCEQKGSGVPCKEIDEESCEEGCVCVSGTLRNDDGECIPEDQCADLCPPKEYFTECVEGVCRELNCSQRGQPVLCPDFTDGSCTSGCICYEGFLRDEHGVCIPDDECPEICPLNEELSNCTQIVCRPQTCAQRGKPVACTAIAEQSCKQDCVCVSGTLRNADGDCIPEDECEGLCPPGEEFTECIQTECRAQDCSQIGQPLACPDIESYACISGCVCPEGSVRNKYGICIPEENCPVQTCPPNEEFNTCTQAICRPLNCSQKDQSVTCATEVESCESGCVCQAGFLRTNNGDCVPEDHCYVQLVCDENEIVDACPGNCSDYCPLCEDDDTCSRTDPTPDTCGAPVCKCRFNYKRDNANGTCIPTRDCPPFDCSAGPNQEYDPCPPLCPSDDCSQATPSGRCPIFGRIGIVVECEPKCRCIEGYWRNNGICVPYADCPGICPENEEFSNCTQAIGRPENCTQIGQPVDCSEPIEGTCQEGCVCIEGTLRAENGSCIPEDQCPEQICNENEMLNECPNGCDNDACPQNYKYQNVDDCIAPAVCLTPQCQCISNYKRDDNGTCIPIEDCPGICPENEEFSKCIQALCRGDNCTQIGQSINCPLVLEDSCQQGCVCISGTLRSENGSCIPEDQCPGQICDDNEMLNECPNGCDDDTCPENLNDQYDDGCIAPAVCLPPQCQCIENYKRNESGICIPVENCPGICANNEEYCDCIQAVCRAQSCSERGQAIACAAIEDGSCKSGCICVEGTLRSENGSCIPEDQCAELSCGENETLNECPSVCETDACPTDFNDNDEQPCIKICGPPTCECIESYKRDENGNCIPIADCPGICPDYEEYSSCTQATCRAQNCTQIGQPIACPRIAEGFCIQGCVCVEGTLRNGYGNCVPVDQCEESLICGENEEVNECTSVCNTDACPTNFNNEDEEACIAVCGPPQCECISNYKRDIYGDCIPIEDCPGICPDNEEYSYCTQTLCRAQNCTQIGQLIACSDEVEGSCQPGCVCIQGTLRDENGNCISENQCPEQICGENEQFNECTSVCNTDACPINFTDESDEPCILICGPPKCECISNYKRDDNGDCIPIEDCPGICPENEEYCYCTDALCRAQNCTQIGQEIACSDEVEDSCKPGCVCIQGTLRDENGNCIPENQCPGPIICNENEELNECTSLCSTDDCPTYLNETEEICVDVCGPPKCECISNYKRDDYGDCIPIEECPEVCPVNEEYSTCIQSLCRAQNCTQRGKSISCPRVLEGFCQKGCVCVEGTLRNEYGNCVPVDQCEEQQQCNLPNEVLSCVPDCPPERTCKNREIKFNCLEDNKPCQQKCVCKEDYFRNYIGECISGNECDQCNGKNEFFSCGQECDNECKNLATQNRTNCPLINIQCNRKCYCEDGFARDDYNNCVPVDKCPEQENKCSDPNEQYYDCKKTCPPDTCLSLVAKFKCRGDPECEPGCLCKPGFLRKNDTSPCMPMCDCSEIKNSLECTKKYQ